MATLAMHLLLLLLLLLVCSINQCWSWVGPAVDKTRVVYPFRTDSRGHVISPDVSSTFHDKDGGRRVKREARDNNTTQHKEEKLYIVINNDNEELFLKLTPNTNLVTPYTLIEWVMEDGTRVLKRASGDCFYIGRLKSTRESLVAISNCDGLTGYIQTQNDSYFIEPLRRGEAQDEASRSGPQPHLIYKVQSITSRLNLSLQQDQEYQHKDNHHHTPSHRENHSQQNHNHQENHHNHQENHHNHQENHHNHREKHHHPHPQQDTTFLELDKLLKTKKRTSATDQQEQQENASETERERFKRSQNTVPKFRRDRIPKFVRTSSSFLKSERHGRSTALKAPKFERRLGASRDSERSKREEDTVAGGMGQHRERADAAPSVHPTPNGRNKFRKKKDCRRTRPGEDGGPSAGQTDNDGDTCHDQPLTRLERAERARRRQERRDQKKREKEERRRERERRKQDKRRKKKGRKHKQGDCRKMGGAEAGKESQGREAAADGTANDVICRARQERRDRRREERKREKHTIKQNKDKKRHRMEMDMQSEETLTSTLPEVHSRVVDPFEGEEWNGYSPDMWETQVAAGTSGLTEVSLGAAVNVSDPQKWLELVVAVDHTVIDFHGEDEVEKYVFTLFNIVSAIYEDPSLEANLELVMLRIIFYKDAKHSQVREGLAKKSLEGVNRWGERLYRVSPPHLRHDVAVWLTRTNLGGPSGYAPVAGICEPSRSCTLNRDEGLTSAFIIAHEMAHVLGLSHDGDSIAVNDCEDEGFQGSVMAPLVAATFSRFHWSKCSKREYHARAQGWGCLMNKPQWKNATRVLSTIKYQYSLHDQCRLEFGDGYGLCSSFGLTDPCTHLWCSNTSVPHHCKTKKGPPLEGTSCGEQKWCRHGFCVAVSQETEDTEGESPVKHNPQDGGWGTWTQWGPCSRTCGTGVAFRTRDCDNPPPAWGGRRCRGKREEWKTCGLEACSLPHQDFRAQQCAFLTRIVTLDPRRAALSWLPYEAKRRKKKCRISCYSHATNEVYMGREYVVDGTRCSYDQPNDICVQGKCVALGCDKVVGSRAQEDECGVCGGDGATCLHHKFEYNEVPPTDYSLVAILPAGAYSIMINEEAPTMNFLALTDNSSSFFLNGGRSQEPSKTFISEGAKFVYSSQSEREMLQARGPLLKPVSIMIHGSRAQESVHITTTFQTQLQQEHYQWEVGPFTACSVTCGGGKQHQTLVCRDRRTDTQVFHNKCKHLPRPSLNTTTCNTFGCEAKWMTGPWEHCSTTCGPHGVQERMVSCVTIPEADTANWTAGIVDPLRCSADPMPEAQRECLRHHCPAHWTPIGWDECSSTCGEGVETRLWECVGGGGNEVTYDCGIRPHQVRVCIKPSCPPVPCLRDASEFCQLPVLHRYCQVPKYRELCCHTCGNVVY